MTSNLSKYLALAEKGDVEAQSNLGEMYYLGEGVKENYAEALKWFRKAARKGNDNSTAQHYLGLMYFHGYGVKKSNTTAVKWVRLAAEQGDKNAQFNLGEMYETGQGVSQRMDKAVSNLKEAAYWYRLAAEQGHMDAQFKMGQRGGDVEWEYDVLEAMKWYRLAAEQGHVDAMKELADMYEDPHRGVQDFPKAIKWWQLAVDRGDEWAQDRLDSCKLAMERYAEDAETAETYRKDADKGNAEAQISLGFMYECGKGVPMSNDEAIQWYRKAADQGNAEAQYLLGEIYAFVSDEEGDEPYKWYRKAAEQGHRKAQYALAMYYLKGRGSKSRNLKQALIWEYVLSLGSDDVKKWSTKVRKFYEKHFGRFYDLDIDAAIMQAKKLYGEIQKRMASK